VSWKWNTISFSVLTAWRDKPNRHTQANTPLFPYLLAMWRLHCRCAYSKKLQGLGVLDDTELRVQMPTKSVTNNSSAVAFGHIMDMGVKIKLNHES